MMHILALVSLSAFVSLALFPFARRSGTPLLVIVLGVGMLAGENGIGGYTFNDYQFAFDIGSLALAIILFVGGLETSLKAFKMSGVSAIVMATLGVIITAFVLGGLVHFVLGISLLTALLLGAVLAPTDAAATFMLIQQSDMKLSPRVENTLLLESGLNDPVGIFMTVVLTVLVATQGVAVSAGAIDHVIFLAMQIVFGILGGLLGGRLLAFAMNNLDMPTGTYPVLAITGALFVFSATALVGGSGFLAVYLAGIAVRARLKHPLERILNFSEGLQWLSQILLFLMLGLLVTPSSLAVEISTSLIVAAILMFIARPVATFLSLGWLGYTWRELVFISWVGLRGAVPILLAIYPIIAPGPLAREFFNIVFIVVVSSLLLQGLSAKTLGRLLKINHAKAPEPPIPEKNSAPD